MKAFPHFLFTVALCSLLFAGACKKEKEVIYDVDNVNAEVLGADKNKLKSEQQYVAALHANLFQDALSVSSLQEITDLILSCGDKDVIHEILISNFMNEADVLLPTSTEMRDDIGLFIDETYERFLIRPPTQLEKAFLTDYIENNQDATPELIYFGFALSNEYQFY